VRTLYLGLRPKPGTFHYPVIKTVPLEVTIQPFTHVIFTSQTTVEYWKWPLDGKVVIAIGEATAKNLPNPIIAPVATQEGIIALLKTMDLKGARICYPKSKRARPLLSNYLKNGFTVDLYDTLLQKPEPVPNLDDFDEIVFTSPSTVEGFLEIFGELPKAKHLVFIGPITEKRALLV
jgi:uroporphyrinogen-III synthase